MAKRPSPDAWLSARQRWEADPTETFESIAQWMTASGSPVSRVAVSKRAEKESWARPKNLAQISEQAQLRADEKVTAKLSEGHKVSGETPKRQTEEAAIEVRAEVLEIQRADWKKHRELFSLEAIADEFEVGKQAKISAEMLAIRHRGEREAYGIDIDRGKSQADGMTVVTIKDFTGRLKQPLPPA